MELIKLISNPEFGKIKTKDIKLKEINPKKVTKEIKTQGNKTQPDPLSVIKNHNILILSRRN